MCGPLPLDPLIGASRTDQIKSTRKLGSVRLAPATKTNREGKCLRSVRNAPDHESCVMNVLLKPKPLRQERAAARHLAAASAASAALAALAALMRHGANFEGAAAQNFSQTCGCTTANV